MDGTGNTPPDLIAIIGLKFTFALSININSYYSSQKKIQCWFNPRSPWKATNNTNYCTKCWRWQSRNTWWAFIASTNTRITINSNAKTFYDCYNIIELLQAPRSLTYSPIKMITKKQQHPDSSTSTTQPDQLSKAPTSNLQSPPKRFKTSYQASSIKAEIIQLLLRFCCIEESCNSSLSSTLYQCCRLFCNSTATFKPM
jgi:hypothetical protein